jgi:hypothetical protein
MQVLAWMEVIHCNSKTFTSSTLVHHCCSSFLEELSILRACIQQIRAMRNNLIEWEICGLKLFSKRLNYCIVNDCHTLINSFHFLTSVSAIGFASHLRWFLMKRANDLHPISSAFVIALCTPPV